MEEEPEHIICQSALSACLELIRDLNDNERINVFQALIDYIAEDELILLATEVFENILAKRDPKLVEFMPKDFLEKAILATHTLSLNGLNTNVLYNLAKSLTCSQFGLQHLPLDSLPFSLLTLLVSSLFGDGCEKFHLSDNGHKFSSWLQTNCPEENAEEYIEQMNKLLFPWDHVKYKVLPQKKIALNIYGEYRSVFEQSEELGIIESVVLDPTEKEIELCSLDQAQVDLMSAQGAHIILKEEVDEEAIEETQQLSVLIKQEQDQISYSQGESINEKVTSGNKKFACYVCSQKFNLKESLKQHMVSFHCLQEDGTFKCSTCNEVFLSADDLTKHENTHVYKCNSCSVMFINRIQYIKHKRLHKKDQVKCHNCVAMFSSKADMFEHIAQEHCPKPFQCPYCDMKCPRMRHLRFHVSEMHKDKSLNLPCKKCSKTFIIPKNLERHIKRVHGSTKLCCHLCSKSYKHMLALQFHKKKVHNIEMAPLHRCTCGKSFGTRASLLRHKAVIHGRERRYACPYCSNSYPKKGVLNRHMMDNHIEVMKKEHTCSDCNTGFVTESRMMKHRRAVHLGEKDYRCNRCPSAFHDRYALERHIKIHLGVKDHKCDLCGNTFHTQKHLHRHTMHVHEGKRTRRPKDVRHPCDQCEKTFVEKRYLIRHQQREHLGRTDYDEQICPICKQSFSGKSSLTRHHRRIHKGIKDHTTRDFQCDICAKTFVFKQSLQRHMQSTHKIAIPEFQCSFCNKRFANSYNLRKHQSNHDGNGPCRPKKRHQKVIGLTLPHMVTQVEEYDSSQPQFIEIQVLEDGQNNISQTYTTTGESNWPTVIQGASIITSDGAATSGEVSSSQFLLDQGMSETDMATLVGDSNQEIIIEAVNTNNVWGGKQEPDDEDTTGKETHIFEIPKVSTEQGMGLVEVPVGVQYIKLGGKLVKLDTV